VGRVAEVYSLATVIFPEEYADQIAPPLSPLLAPHPHVSTLTAEELRAVTALKDGAEVILDENNILVVQTPPSTASASQPSRRATPPSTASASQPSRRGTPGGILNTAGAGSRMHTPGSVRFVDMHDDRTSRVQSAYQDDVFGADELQNAYTAVAAGRRPQASGQVDYMRIDDEYSSRPATSESILGMRESTMLQEDYTQGEASQRSNRSAGYDGQFVEHSQDIMRQSSASSSSIGASSNKSGGSTMDVKSKDPGYGYPDWPTENKDLAIARRPSGLISSSSMSKRPNSMLAALAEEESRDQVRGAEGASLNESVVSQGEDVTLGDTRDTRAHDHQSSPSDARLVLHTTHDHEDDEQSHGTIISADDVSMQAQQHVHAVGSRMAAEVSRGQPDDVPMFRIAGRQASQRLDISRGHDSTDMSLGHDSMDDTHAERRDGEPPMHEKDNRSDSESHMDMKMAAEGMSTRDTPDNKHTSTLVSTRTHEARASLSDPELHTAQSSRVGRTDTSATMVANGVADIDLDDSHAFVTQSNQDSHGGEVIESSGDKLMVAENICKDTPVWAFAVLFAEVENKDAKPYKKKLLRKS
jgi:hypothetical protein